jgi:hypothetical protein
LPNRRREKKTAVEFFEIFSSPWKKKRKNIFFSIEKKEHVREKGNQAFFLVSLFRHSSV